MLPSVLYQQKIDSGALTPDDAQAAALPALDRLARGLAESRRGGLLRRLLKHDVVPKGLYMYGPVGRGKSLLMDLLYAAIPDNIAKRRQHFFDFMRGVHRNLARARDAGSTDPLALVTAELVASVRLLCFDELFVKDVADAMILSRLFTGLIDHGVTIVFTSNCAPDELYAGGLQRVRFLPFIELVKQRMDVIAVAGPQDHRRLRLAGQETYISPLDGHTSAKLQAIFDRLRGDISAGPVSLDIDGRTLDLRCAAGDTLLTSFDELCARPLGPPDMLEIAAHFHTVIMDGVPRLDITRRNEATRFLTLVDALYDARRQLIVAADALPDDLYKKAEVGDDPLAFDFRRAASRLVEMQAADYQAGV